MGKISLPNSAFKDVVSNTPDISKGYRAGLTALGKYSSKIVVPINVTVEGSVDIDSTTISLYPRDSRWDYVIGFNGKVIFVEVHSANTGEVDVVLKKLDWLKNWLNSKASELARLRAPKPYFWVQSKNFQILKHSSQYRRAASRGILPVSKVTLNPG
jgi:hypothetical protein